MHEGVGGSCRCCGGCQLCKEANKDKFGEAPAKEAGQARWGRVNVGLYGPAAIKGIPGGKELPKEPQELGLHALAMAGPVAGWFGAASLASGPSAHGAQELFDEHWSARHPRPKGFLGPCAGMGLGPKRSSA